MSTSTAAHHQSPPAVRGTARPELVGGHPAVDLVNTVSWRNDPPRTTDRLGDARSLVRWMRAVRLVSARQATTLREQLADSPEAGRQALEQSRRLRELSHRVLRAVAAGTAPDPCDLRDAQAAIVPALARAEIVTAVPLRWETDVRQLEDIADALALTLWRLLQFEDLRRLRECHDRGCGWLFLDRSKNGSRVWCSSADCGNRIRARRHYERRRANRSAPGGAGGEGSRQRT